MAEGKKKQKKSPWWYKLGILVFGAVFCVSAFMAGRDYLAAKKEADAFDSLSKLAAEYAEEKAPADLTESAGETTDQEKAAEWAELLKEAAGYAALKNENPDYVGWIRIPDTRIDYPVVDRESDPEYYLHRVFDGSKSFGGTPFLGEASGVDTKCLIIYGHNMKTGPYSEPLIPTKRLITGKNIRSSVFTSTENRGLMRSLRRWRRRCSMKMRMDSGITATTGISRRRNTMSW